MKPPEIVSRDNIWQNGQPDYNENIDQSRLDTQRWARGLYHTLHKHSHNLTLVHSSGAPSLLTPVSIAPAVVQQPILQEVPPLLRSVPEVLAGVLPRVASASESPEKRCRPSWARTSARTVVLKTGHSMGNVRPATCATSAAMTLEVRHWVPTRRWTGSCVSRR